MKKTFTLMISLMVVAFTNVFAQELGEGQIWWGYYNGTQKTSLYGTYKLDTYDVAMFVAGDGDLSGTTIYGARFQSRTYSNAVDCKIWVRETLDGENLAEATFTPSTSWIGANFDTPIEMPSTGVYVGYTFTLSNWYSDYDYTPIVYCSKVVKNAFWAKTTSGGSWENQSSKGALAGQVIVGGGSIGTNSVAVDDDLNDIVTVKGRTIPVTLTLINQGSAGVNSIDYTYTLDGTTGEGHADLATPIEAMYKAQGTCTITLPASSKIGTQVVDITVNKVNGEANEETENNVASFALGVLEYSADRKSLVETYVSAKKQYSPLAYVGMENLKDSLNDTEDIDVIPVAIHVGDAMALDAYSDWTSSINSYPTCHIDRTKWTHPYYGDATSAPYHFQADDVVEDYNNAVSEVEVAVHATWNPDEDTQVNASTDLNFLTEADKSAYRIIYMLVADSLSGEGSDWDQVNYICYYGSSYPDDDMAYYRDECGYTITGHVYNNVVIDINNVRGQALNDETNDNTLTIPEWAANGKNFRVVAALYNEVNGQITNADVTTVTDAGAISDIFAEDNTDAPVNIYNLQGQRINEDNMQQGIYIVKKGSQTKKIMVK